MDQVHQAHQIHQVHQEHPVDGEPTWRATWCLREARFIPCIFRISLLGILPPLPISIGWSAARRILDRNIAAGGWLSETGSGLDGQDLAWCEVARAMIQLH